jgi:hypothetical protein
VDFKTIAGWQGHQDGGVLIAKTYSHLRNEHSDNVARKLVAFCEATEDTILRLERLLFRAKDGGAEGSRTPDLLIANETFYQLNYGPKSFIYNYLRRILKLLFLLATPLRHPVHYKHGYQPR